MNIKPGGMNFVPDRSSFIDRPFGVPPDVVLDIPVPPSVNETRKINYAALRKVENWKAQCDMRLMESGQFRFAAKNKPESTYELVVILSEEKCKLDPDNTLKCLCDYLRRLELIRDDSPKFAKQLIIRWGEAPEGVRLLLRPYVEAV